MRRRVLGAVAAMLLAVPAMAGLLPASGAGSTLAAPLLGATANVSVVSGHVRLKRPGARRFVGLSVQAHIPFGSTLDTTHGRVTVTTALPAGTGTQSSDFYAGRFLLTQTSDGMTTAALTGGPHCRSARGAAAARRKVKLRRLWGSGHGRFRTLGHYASAAVRGTRWLTTDSCKSTRVTVAEGSVVVDDLVAKRNVVLSAPDSYTAQAPAPFRVERLAAPAFVLANGPSKDMSVFYRGHPSFPLTLVADPTSCPQGVTCGHPRIIVNTPANPLVFKGFWNCVGNHPTFTFHYTLFLSDAAGRRTPARRVHVVCRAHK